MVAKRKNYPPEFKRDALDLVYSSKDRSLTDIARGLEQTMPDVARGRSGPQFQTVGDVRGKVAQRGVHRHRLAGPCRPVDAHHGLRLDNGLDVVPGGQQHVGAHQLGLFQA
jgi:hypothetical protein